MKHRKILWIGVIFLVTIASQRVFGQFHCYTENEESLSNIIFSPSVCDEESNYSPADASQTPLITVRLAFHIFQKDNRKIKLKLHSSESFKIFSKKSLFSCGFKKFNVW